MNAPISWRECRKRKLVLLESEADHLSRPSVDIVKNPRTVLALGEPSPVGLEDLGRLHENPLENLLRIER